MYEDKDYNAVYALNSYLRRLLETNLEWDSADYGALDPVIPSSQQPELLQTGLPFIVYGSAVQTPGHAYVIHNESVAYNIYSTSSTEANKIAGLLGRVFERQDDAAADVNDWLRKEVRTPKRKVFFHTVKLTMVEKAEPSDEEGGFVSALVLVEVQYVTEPQTITTVLSTT